MRRTLDEKNQWIMANIPDSPRPAASAASAGGRRASKQIDYQEKRVNSKMRRTLDKSSGNWIVVEAGNVILPLRFVLI